MLEAFIRTFVPNADQTELPAVRNSYGTFASIVCIVCNVLLCVGKGVVGVLSGSVSIVADAVNNLSDASSNIISLIGFRLASKPADEEHPYGHGRIEYLAGVAVSVLIMFIGIELIKTSAQKIAEPSPTDFSPVIVGILIGSMLVKLWMAHFNHVLAQRIDSVALEATSVDSRNDVITTAAVLGAAVVSALTGFDLDGWAGLVVGAFIVASGVGLVRDTLNPLLGEAPDPALVRHIHDKILSYPGVLGTHDLMVHDYGPGRQFASAHVEMAAEVDPMESHDTIDNIEQEFLSQDNLHVVLHYDPIVTDDPKVTNLRNWIAQQVTMIHPKLTIHDLRTVPGPTHTNVIFDCVRPHELEMSDDELRGTINGMVREKHPTYNCVITIDQSYVSSK
ncbi:MULTISPECIES: cation diffusion facilitator family transporter [Atopobiaceae]|uniref:Cation diffusion facilitator family transporter n=1 Tax=Parafannyhessea umbonata TaxID=604330 RepID=A0A1H9MYQ7_9ACTN|nr:MULTISPECIES: cation diffusion facilitator family transporter [Atopobiaceae]SEH36368.1 cation diffusion facilitator family transporter [Parafannyhessea umbonata]SER28850.1 cation diffusion facilitator family transporter [Parafannyhessea umbonata]SJZ37837.1 cation diffusion facilitator family transporter [Olsenella sp. KH1P3]